MASRSRTGKGRPTRARATPVRARAKPRSHRPGISRAEVAIILLLASPAVIIPDGLDRFVFGKLLVAAAGAAVAFTVAPVGRFTTVVRALLAAGAATLTLSALLSASPWSAVLGRAERYEGVFVLGTYLLAGACGARLLGPGRTARGVQVALTTMAAVSVLVAFVAVLETAGLRPLSSNLDRPGSLLGNASDEGALAVLYGLLLTVSVLRRPNWPAGIGAAAAVATVVMSASRGALLGLVVVLVVLGIVSTRRIRLAVIGAVAAVAVLALAIPFTRARVLDASPFAAQTVSGRQQLWSQTLSLIAHRPVLGIGPSQFQVAVVAEHDRRWETTVGPANPPESPHDWVLQALSAGGVVLLIVLLALIVVLVRRSWPALRAHDSWVEATTAGVAGYAVALLFHLTAPGTTIPAALLAGSLLAVPVAQAGRSRLAPLVSGVAALLVVVFTCASIAEIVLRQATVDVLGGDLAAADHDFGSARVLRPWDVDLPAQALHEFAVVAQSGGRAAVPYGRTWWARTGPVRADEQVVQDHAAVLEAAGDYPAALAVIGRQLLIDRYNPLLILRRGVLYAELHEYGDAERDFRTAASIAPGSPQPWQDLAVLFEQTHQPARAAAARAAAKRRGG